MSKTHAGADDESPAGEPDRADHESVRERVRTALGDEAFVAAFRRRTAGPLSDPVVSRERFETVADLPEAPLDPSPMRTELVVYSESHVYRWVVTGGTVERTRLPRSPAAMARQR